MDPSAVPDSPRRTPRPENIWLNLLCNIVVPALIMSKLSATGRLGPVWAMVLGLAFPLGYGIYDLAARRKWNIFSIVGVAGVAATGTLGLLKAGLIWFAVKEATLPLMFAGAILATLRTRRPLVRELLLNESLIDVARVEAALDAHGTRGDFNRLLRQSTWMLAGSFVLSALLNFILARLILTSPAGTTAFTEQLGRMTWISFPVIVLPGIIILAVIMMRFFSGLHRLTGLDFDQVQHPRKPRGA